MVARMAVVVAMTEAVVAEKIVQVTMADGGVGQDDGDGVEDVGAGEYYGDIFVHTLKGLNLRQFCRYRLFTDPDFFHP